MRKIILESQETCGFGEESFKGMKDVGHSSGAGKVPHRPLYTQSSFGWLGGYDCVVFGSFVLGLTDAKSQEWG